ncbi:MAG: aminotransferase class V-fold PLP-dependent enzyme [Planctomycetia bacterium]|nr:aminotransferase class V-fold PLP-dependent enzyme [Planctomycetia bacterium]
MTIYLDNAATSFPKPESVYRAMDAFARSSLGNPGRSGHQMAQASEAALNDCRHRLNILLGGLEVDRWAFTLNCTDALNMAIKGTLRDGDHVITTDLEHNSVSRPLRAMELAGVITLSRVRASRDGSVDPDDVRAAFTPRTRLVTMTHASNVLGTVQPIEILARMTRERDAIFLLDAAQTAGVLPIHAEQMMIDLLAVPGHKSLMGPTGTGALYVGSRAVLRPWREGGTGGDSFSETQPTKYPFFLEGGTPNVIGLVGLAAGIAWVQEQGLERIHHHELGLARRLWEGLDKLDCTVLGHRDTTRRVATVSFTSDRETAPNLGMILDTSFEIAIRPGFHCAPYIHVAQGTRVTSEGAVRVSPGPFNTEADIDALLDALSQVVS